MNAVNPNEFMMRRESPVARVLKWQQELNAQATTACVVAALWNVPAITNTMHIGPVIVKQNSLPHHPPKHQIKTNKQTINTYVYLISIYTKYIR